MCLGPSSTCTYSVLYTSQQPFLLFSSKLHVQWQCILPKRMNHELSALYQPVTDLEAMSGQICQSEIKQRKYFAGAVSVFFFLSSLLREAMDKALC